MLILGRKAGQAITIDTGTDVIRIKVERLERGQAVIGVEAPRKYKVLRDELLERPENIQRSR